MLKKSGVNPPAPFVEEARPRGKGIPSNPPQASTRTGGSSAGVILTEARPAKEHGSTFRAPRSDSEGGPMEKGYTKVGM